MEKEKIIKKAKEVVKVLGLNYLENEEPLLTEEFPKILTDNDSELIDKFSISFKTEPFPGRKFGEGFSIIGNNKTEKLLFVITKSGMYKVPEELS